MYLSTDPVKMAADIQHSSELDTKSKAKLKAAYKAVDDYVKSGQVVGIGSGSTVVFAVDRLKERVSAEGLQITCIPTSFQARQLILENGLVLGDLNITPEIDVAIDGADEVDSQLNCIKGGGGCLLQEKIIASNAKQFVVIADFTKMAEQLGTKWTKGVPIEVSSICYVAIQRKLRAMGGEPVLRMAKSKAGPCVTDNGNFIIDCHFGAISNPHELNQKLLNIPGIVDTGLFVNMAEKAYFGMSDGSVETREKAIA
eukprot:TRINITY_DN8230_c0_g1_i1.p2 TRINITY_DN8230_c0_g1~~TRINITY_DN8230_c0_g1_i1.p2  ORF type:complete len:256 (+),score=50.97 TRINITY_DN8230_c0_g1_i1:1326-2093(+)